MNTNTPLGIIVVSTALAILSSGCSAVRVGTREFHQHDSGLKPGYLLSEIDRAGTAPPRPNRPHTFEATVGWRSRYSERSGAPVLPVIEWNWDAWQYRGAVQFLRLTDGVTNLGGPVERATLRFTRRVEGPNSSLCGGEPLRRILVASAPWQSGFDRDPATHDDGRETRRGISFVPDLEIPFRVGADFIEADVTRVVQRWVSGDLPNHGLLLHSGERFHGPRPSNLFATAQCIAFYNDFVLEVRTRDFVTQFSSRGLTAGPVRSFALILWTDGSNRASSSRNAVNFSSRAQRNAFRRRDARLRSRTFAHWNQSLRRSPNSNRPC